MIENMIKVGFGMMSGVARKKICKTCGTSLGGQWSV